ncbi:MAG: hypothetical protein ACTTKD_06570 [Peptoanaerobacter stomatis]|uniref:hypothetical protein n=1 Tax=Peptoanaerobacter stomatis TaxID=796937 RepID=UPI003FA09932
MYNKSGTVTSVSPFLVVLDGEETGREFKKLSSYEPKLNDRVILISHGSSYVVLGGVS